MRVREHMHMNAHAGIECLSPSRHLNMHMAFMYSRSIIMKRKNINIHYIIVTALLMTTYRCIAHAWVCNLHAVRTVCFLVDQEVYIYVLFLAIAHTQSYYTLYIATTCINYVRLLLLLHNNNIML